jgi:hypothetical protein
MKLESLTIVYSPPSDNDGGVPIQPSQPEALPSPALIGDIGHTAVAPRVLTAEEVIAQYGEDCRDGYDAFPMTETDPSVIDEQIRVGLEVTKGNTFNFLNNLETVMPGNILTH